MIIEGDDDFHDGVNDDNNDEEKRCEFNY